MPSRVKQREQYHQRKAEGKCPQCGVALEADWGKITCECCIDKNKYYASINGSHARRYRRLKAEGKCRECGAPADAGIRCRPCADRFNHNQRIRKQARIAEGLCRECGDELPEGYTYKTCATCLEIARIKGKVRDGLDR